jgi:hypothetical protein
LKKIPINKTEVWYLFIKTTISTTKRKQHYEIHFELKPWGGCQMVNIKIFNFIFWSKIWIEMK